MKFNFKIQQYQTDAVENTVNVFTGQPSRDNALYRRDLGKKAQKRLTLEGNIVISVGLFGHSGDDEVWNEGTTE